LRKECHTIRLEMAFVGEIEHANDRQMRKKRAGADFLSGLRLSAFIPQANACHNVAYEKRFATSNDAVFELQCCLSP